MSDAQTFNNDDRSDDDNDSPNGDDTYDAQ